jgi:competence protein CoiA
MRRTIDYHQRGIYVLWLLQWTPKLDAERYTPKLWERWIHAAYYGHVFYWTGGLDIVSYHFDPHHTVVPRKTWYSKNGKNVTAGGYSKRSKLHRRAMRERTLNLATDFGPKVREWWEGNGVRVPDAKLFTAFKFDC